MKRSQLSIQSQIGTIAFSPKTLAVPLQVADFMAYESFCYLVKRETRGQEAYSLQQRKLLGRNFQRLVYLDGDALNKLLANCPMKPNAFFRPPDPRPVPLGRPTHVRTY